MPLDVSRPRKGGLDAHVSPMRPNLVALVAEKVGRQTEGQKKEWREEKVVAMKLPVLGAHSEMNSEPTSAASVSERERDNQCSCLKPKR